MRLCSDHKIEQRFTRVRNPKTNGKAERVIKTLMDLWHDKNRFDSSAHRKTELKGAEEDRTPDLLNAMTVSFREEFDRKATIKKLLSK